MCYRSTDSGLFSLENTSLLSSARWERVMSYRLNTERMHNLLVLFIDQYIPWIFCAYIQKYKSYHGNCHAEGNQNVLIAWFLSDEIDGRLTTAMQKRKSTQLVLLRIEDSPASIIQQGVHTLLCRSSLSVEMHLGRSWPTLRWRRLSHQLASGVLLRWIPIEAKREICLLARLSQTSVSSLSLSIKVQWQIPCLINISCSNKVSGESILSRSILSALLSSLAR